MRILITGASGQLGAYLLQELQGSAHEVIAWSGSSTGELFGLPLRPVDFREPAQFVPALMSLSSFAPDLVIHLAAMSNAAACGDQPSLAHQINYNFTDLLISAMARRSRLIYASTDLVFDGANAHYSESDLPCPLSAYGQTKKLGEGACLGLFLPAARVNERPHTLVVRLSLLFGPSLNGRAAFFDQQLQALREGRPLKLFEDEWRTPLSLKTAAEALLALAESDRTGLLHIGGPERMSRLEMGQRLAAHLGRDPSVFIPARRDDVPTAEPRPRDTSLNCARWRSLFPNMPWPKFEDALAEMGVR
jgi:dTDP-4-dehydrorhamnose reductase